MQILVFMVVVLSFLFRSGQEENKTLSTAYDKLFVSTMSNARYILPNCCVAVTA